MTRPLLLAAAVLALPLSACASGRTAPAPQRPTLQPFRSEAELAAFHRRMAQRWAEQYERRAAEERRRQRGDGPGPIIGHPHGYGYEHILPPPPTPLPVPPRQYERMSALSSHGPLTGARQAGGDERPLVQLHGDHLVVLRRGRLFTVRIGGGALQPVGWVDAFGFTPVGGWHDELLVAGDRAVVIGGNFGMRDTELNLFHLTPNGEPTYRDAYYVQSMSDLHASHAYAARLAEGRLVFYAQQGVNHTSASNQRPMLSRWGVPREPTAPATRVYRHPGGDLPLAPLAMHNVMRCDLAGEGLHCQSTALFGAPGRVFHVSPTAVYVWSARAGARPAMLYRMPMDGSAPTALQVSGEPVDPSAFLESADGHLNVLLRPDPEGGAGRDPQAADGPLALLRVPLAELGDGSRAAAPARYRPLPIKTRGALRHRFVGDWLVYGAGGKTTPGSEAFAVRWAGGPVWEVPLPHGVDRIEAMGSGAVVMGIAGGSLHLATLRLGPEGAVAADRVTLPGDTIHGFFYHPQGDDTGVVAVPVRGPVRPGVEGLLLGADRIRFLRNRGLRLQEMGELSAGALGGDDECVTSCLNWYGGTRPLFVDGRVFALLGYELVEAREEAARIREVRRVSFAPHPPRPDLRGSWTLTATVGERGGRYVCSSRGDVRIDRTGTGLSVGLSRTAECVVDGAASTSRWEGNGKGEVHGNAVRLDVDACVYEGRLRSPDHLGGRVACRAHGRDGAFLPVTGTWEARRARP